MDDQLERAAKRLKSAADDHHANLGAEIQKLDDEEKRLKDRLRNIETKKQECAAENGTLDVRDDDFIEINAGGKIIAARRGTLCQLAGTRLEALFSGRWDKKLLRDNCGRIFLDVNPKAFRAIVDWLNVLVISSEDDSPPAPSVDEEHKYILSDHIKLFLKNRAVTHIDSKIINSVNEEEIIHDLLREDGSDGNLNLLYRSSRDGLSAEAFHETCDNVGPTLVIIETTEGGVVGGYSNSPWDGNKDGDDTAANKAFLFALSGFGLSSPCKRRLKYADDEVAICNYDDKGPAFGQGHDLLVEGSHVVISLWCSFAPFETAELPQRKKIYPIKEMEVFQMSDILALPWFQIQSPKVPQKKLPATKVDRFTEEINDAINERWATLRKLEEDVVSLEESFEDEHRFIDLFACGSVKDVVMLNVSGSNMATKRDTLLAVEESMLAQQFDDTKWTEQGSNNTRVKEWTPDEVSNWAKSIEGMQQDVSGIFLENSINGLELLALDRDGLKDIGVKRAGTICLLLKEIKKLEKASEDVVTFIEHSPYCFGKILDFLRWKHLSSVGLTMGPARPSVSEHKRELFEKMIRYYFPGESSKLILGRS